MSLLNAKEGVYILHNNDTHELYGYSLTTGNKLWGPTKLPGTALSTLTVAGDIAYGNAYVWDFGGYVSAVNINTGVKTGHTFQEAQATTHHTAFTHLGLRFTEHRRRQTIPLGITHVQPAIIPRSKAPRT
jgi:hypothetical protein